MEQMYKHTDLFLTHTWRTDLQGRDNHTRVRIINEHLNRLGYLTWFDEKSMSGDIKAKMAEGVDFTKCVLVFVTKEYMKKIDADHDDNCKFEYDRALAQKTEKNILCIVMEEEHQDPNKWFGKLKLTLGNCLLVSMAGDLNDKKYLKQQIQLVVEQLKSKGVVPSQRKNKCENCTLTSKNGKQQQLFSDGNACTYCGENLKSTSEPKNYCVACHIHSNGSFCHVCKLHLLDKNQRIQELKEQLLELISLESNAYLTNYDVKNFQDTIENMKNDLQDLQNQRSVAQNNGLELHIKEKEYYDKVKELQTEMDDLMNSTSTLDATTHKCLQSLGPSYEEELSRFDDYMRSLDERRKEYSQNADDFSKTMEKFEQLGKHVLDFSTEAVEGERPLHGKNCSCDECVFEQELTLQLISNAPQYLKSFIVSNDTEKLKTVIDLRNEIKDLYDENGLNLLMSLTVNYGTVEMFRMLLRIGVYFNIEKSTKLGKKLGENIFRKVINDNDVQGLRKIIELQKEFVNLKNEDGSNLLLFFCIKYGTLDMFNMLIEMGCEAGIVNAKKKTLLHCIENIDIARLLCEKYGDVLLKIKDQDGFTPFMIAHHNNNLPVVETMKTFVNAEEEISVYIGLQELEKRGIDYIKELIKNNDIITMEILLTFKPDVVNMMGENNSTPFLLCCRSGSTEMMKLLVDSGSDVNKCGMFGYTALMLAVLWNETEWCKEVVEYLCTTETQLLTMENNDGESVFHYAAFDNKENLIPILLKYSPPPQLLEKRNNIGDTPIDYAKRWGYEPILMMYTTYIGDQTKNTATGTK